MGRAMKIMEENEDRRGRCKIRQREDGARFLLSSLSYLSLSNKNKRKNNEHVKEPVFFFRLGTRKRTEAIGREEGFAAAWGGSTDKEPTPLAFPIHWKRKEHGLHSPLVLPFLRFCHLKGNRRREGREKERGETKGLHC